MRTELTLRCVDCHDVYPPELLYRCVACGGILETVGDDGLAPVSLGELVTPLLRARRIEASLSGFRGEVWLKDETRNPSGSFKDRLVAAAMARALSLGVRRVVCASSGNAGAATAAYAARAGIPAVVIVPAHTPLGKVTQIAAYGATLLLVEGHYSRSYDLALSLAERHGFANLTTTFINPYAVAGLTSVGREIATQLGRAPDHALIPTGSGPLVKGVWQGLTEQGSGTKLVAVQAEGCAPIVRAFERGDTVVTAWGRPQTIASGISDPLIGYERDGTYTLRLVRESGGSAVAVGDAELRVAMARLASSEGIYAEPTGASPIAALPKLLASGILPADATVVCLITGHGFKDPKIYQDMPARTSTVANPDDIEAVAQLCDRLLRRS